MPPWESTPVASMHPPQRPLQKRCGTDTPHQCRHPWSNVYFVVAGLTTVRTSSVSLGLTNVKPTCFSSSFSFEYFLTSWLALSACAWRATVEPDTDASWLIKVTTRFITLRIDNNNSKFEEKPLLSYTETQMPRQRLTARGRQRSRRCRGSSGLWKASCADDRTCLAAAWLLCRDL